ncbi:hypothetical protein [Frigidibacter sp.]|uniref:hypothetical protein n=1 Tax=Frigidibacter sp. TaxID=2586418 RepID=UPI002735B416|nr:hypothetical protein [Frigidibacter sp.]MDP3341498.1 hypothetical protein [Frigidibacter sp.]
MAKRAAKRKVQPVQQVRMTADIHKASVIINPETGEKWARDDARAVRLKTKILNLAGKSDA